MTRILLLVALLFVASLSAAQIFQWVDEDGQVHFSDQPPAGREAERLDPPSPPADVRMQPSPEGEASSFESPQRPAGAGAGKAPRETHDPGPAECFSPSDDFLGSERGDPFTPISPRSLGPKDAQTVSRLLDGLEGRWQGEMRETECLGRERSPRSEERRFRVSMDVEQTLDDVFRFESELQRADREIYRPGLFWLLLEEGRLYFGDRKTAKYGAPQWRVEIIALQRNSLAFLRKYRQSGARGTSLRHLEWRFLELSGRSLLIRERFYVQGTLAVSRTWTLQRRS